MCVYIYSNWHSVDLHQKIKCPSMVCQFSIYRRRQMFFLLYKPTKMLSNVYLIDNFQVYERRKWMCWPTLSILTMSPDFVGKGINVLCWSTSKIQCWYTLNFSAHFYKWLIEAGNICVEQNTKKSVCQTQKHCGLSTEKKNFDAKYISHDIFAFDKHSILGVYQHHFLHPSQTKLFG